MKSSIKLMTLILLLAGAISVQAMEDMSNHEGSDLIDARREEVKKRREGIRDQVSERRQELRESFENKRAEIRAKLSERQQRIIEKHLTNISIRFENAISRLNISSERIQNHIDEHTEAGVDLSEAQAQLDEANELIDTAITEVDAAISHLKNVIQDEVSKEEIREVIGGAKDAIKDAHAGLVEAVRLIKSVDHEDTDEDEDDDDSEDESDDDSDL